jgi:PAS domain S-box-containing protein
MRYIKPVLNPVINKRNYMKKSSSISHKLIMVLIIVISSVSGLLITMNFFISFYQARQKLFQNSQFITDKFSEVLAGPVWSMNSDEIRRISNTFINTESVVKLRVLYENQVVETRGVQGDDGELIKFQGKIWYNNEIIGSTEIFITEKIIFERQMTGLLYSLLLLFAILAGVAVTIKILIHRMLEIPVTNLITNIEVIAGGKYDFILEPVEQSELNMIIQAINKMSGRIFLRDKELRDARQYLANVFESMTSVLIAVDHEGNVTQCNRSALQRFGIGGDEINKKKFWDLHSELGQFRDTYGDIINSRIPVKTGIEFHEDSGIRYFFITLFPMVSDAPGGMVIRMDDITENTIKDIQLRQAQKMETIGTLAGGLAHDFNNMLGAILGTLSLLKYRLTEKNSIQPEQIMDSLEIIEVSANRAADMVQRLLTLSRQQKLLPASIDLNMTLANIIKICHTTFDKCVEIVSVPAPGPAMVYADPTQMEQVLLNLCINAYHAMTIMRDEKDRRGGRLVTTLEKTEVDRPFCEIHPDAEETRYWKLSVSDTGVGMDSQTIAKIFDPFFTTKKKETGTGLGMSMVYNIIRQHRGFIDIDSEPGIGTVISVYLPCYETGVSETIPREEKVIRPGEGLILIIDDEKIMSSTAKSILEQCGYRAITSENSVEAIDIYTRHRGEIKAVLLDLVMPVLSGEEVFIELKKINPDVKVILTSGYRKDERIERALKLGVSFFIQKPYTFERLADAIKEATAGE